MTCYLGNKKIRLKPLFCMPRYFLIMAQDVRILNAFVNPNFDSFWTQRMSVGIQL
jgi:hypothetical protein